MTRTSNSKDKQPVRSSPRNKRPATDRLRNSLVPERQDNRVPLKQREKCVSSAAAEKTTRTKPKDKAIEIIRDFKRVGDTMYYLVHRTGTRATEDTWEAEVDLSACKDVLTTFQERVRTDSGYAINNNAEHSESPARRSRTSKTRAIVRLKDKEPMELDSDGASSSDFEDDGLDYHEATTTSRSKDGTKRRKTSSSSDAKSSTVKIKKPRGKAAIKAQEAELRQQRQASRAAMANEYEVSSDETDCCMRCSIRQLRRAIDDDDTDRFKTILEDKQNVPNWSEEDVELNDDNLLAYAIKKNRLQHAILLSEIPPFDKSRVTVPDKYKVYGSNTGYVNRSTFGHAVRRVNESRGNRQGDSAFFRNTGRSPLEVEQGRYAERADLAAMVACSQLSDLPETVHEIYQLVFPEVWKQKQLYYCVASGNRALAHKMVAYGDNYRKGLNHLHLGVLKLEENEELETYRRNQILKKAYDSGNLTPFECAAIHPSSKFLRELYAQLTPAERAETDDFGRTVAHFAAASTTPDCLEFLISEGFDFTLGDKTKLTPLILAARYGRHQNIRPLLYHLSKGALPSAEFADHTLLRQKYRPLHYAAYFGHPQTCRALIECGATVDIEDGPNHATPLIMAAQRGHLETVKTLIEFGKADPEYVDRYARTPLHVASINGHYDVVKYLLEQGVNADAPDSSHNRPVHYAAAFGHLRVLKLLIEFGGADPAAANVWRTTACSVANLKGHIAIVQYLLTRPDVDVNFKNKEGCTMLHSCVVEEAESKLETEQILRKTKLLLSRNANPNLKTVDGDTVLHSLARSTFYLKQRPKGYEIIKGNKAVQLELDDEDGIQLQQALAHAIIAAGADMDVVNADGETPLAVAMAANNHPMVHVLLQHGAKYWTAVCSNGNNFFHYLFTAAIELDAMRLQNEMEKLRRERMHNAVFKVWDAVANYAGELPQQQVLTEKINATNHDGYTPVHLGVKLALREQYRFVDAEKRKVKAFYGGSMPDIPQEPEDAIFVFRFDTWIKVAKGIIELFQPDMNATVQLPRDFFKENPKRKKSEYPAETGYTALHLAARSQDASLLEFLLSAGCDPNLRVKIDDTLGNTPMLLGLYLKSFSVTEYLPQDTLQYQEHSNKAFNIQKPDFHAILCKAIEKYLAYGANPCLPNKDGYTGLMEAAKMLDTAVLKSMKELSQSLDGINERDKSGKSAIMYAMDALSNKAVRDIDPSVMQYLLEMGANPNAVYDKTGGDTVFMKAIRLKAPALLDTMIASSQYPLDHEIVNDNLETTAIVACTTKHEGIISSYFQLLARSAPCNVDKMNKDGRTALSLAAQEGYHAAVEALLKHKADLNLHSPGSSPPLSYAFKHGHPEIAEILLKAGADPNIQNKKGFSPLHYAVCAEKHRLVKLLLDYGADVHAVTKNKHTALHMAIERSKSMTNVSFRIERLLLQAGADVNAIDILGRTPLHIAFVGHVEVPDMFHTFKLLPKVTRYMDDAAAKKERTKRLEAELARFGGYDEESDSWLREAILKKLLEAEQPRSQDQDEELTDADDMELIETFSTMKWGKGAGAKEKSDPIDIIKFLASQPGIQYDIPDRFGRTPLHYAACVGAFSCTTHMLEKQVNVNPQDLDKNTPLQLALDYNWVDYCVMLCEHGAQFNDTMTLAKGEQVTPLKHSLSKGLMNLAYLILERGHGALELIQDALSSGKFHVAEIIMSSAEDKMLSGQTESKKQNLWHVIANFKPFDSEMWEQEYLSEFIDKATALGLSIELDIHNRTPLHYAAMHGQTALLRHLLARGAKFNVRDENQSSELWYAVSSNSLECAQILVEAGATVDYGTQPQGKPALLLAVQHQNADLVKFLLKNSKGDTSGQPEAVMYCCVKGLDEILTLLIDAGADINAPSKLTYSINKTSNTAIPELDDISVKKSSKANKELHSVTIHPIFLATDKSLKLLIENGVNPNVFAPSVAPWNGSPCFLHLSTVPGQLENLKLLCQSGLDLDMIDPVTGRTIFYSYLFNTSKNCNYQNPIYEHMVLNMSPKVNIVDSISGMTPLESAIRSRNVILLGRLLAQGADPNIKSCAKDDEYRIYSGGLMNAAFHAVAKNDFGLLQTIHENSRHPIDWLATDDCGRNIVTFLVGSHYSYENTEILKYIASQASNVWQKLLQMVDNEGRTAIDYARICQRSTMYETLLQLGAKPAESDDIVMQEEEEAVVQSMSMDTEYISLQAVETDAEEERQLLQAEEVAAATANKQFSYTAVAEKEEEEYEIDPYANMGKTGEIARDENGEPYDIMLQKIGLSVSYGGYSDNMFYKMSLIYNTTLDVYVLWTRWGAFGEEGMHQKTPYLTKEEAVAEFKSLFRSKTGNNWEDRKEFVRKPGRFELIRAKPPQKPIILKNFDFLDTAMLSRIAPAINEMMQVICNFGLLNKGFQNLEIDIPAGQIPQRSIDEAFEILKQIEETFEVYEAVRMRKLDQLKEEDRQTSKRDLAHKLVTLSTKYYRILPRSSDKDKGIRALCNSYVIEQEKGRLNDLCYLTFSSNVILAAKRRASEIHPLDYCFRSLACQLTEIRPGSVEFSMVNKYMSTTADGGRFEIVHLFGVERQGEAERYAKHSRNENRKLLWHGSRPQNFMGILRQGLRPSPTTAERSGAMFGDGIYFADMFAKSIQYSVQNTSFYNYVYRYRRYLGRSKANQNRDAFSLALLCEVALGKECEMISYYNNTFNKDEHMSIKAIGQRSPDPANAVYDEGGVQIPMGPASIHREEYNGMYVHLQHNEYIVKSESQVRTRYLVLVRNLDYCALCEEETSGGTNDLCNYKLDNISYAGLGDVEQNLVKLALSMRAEKPQDIYDAQLDAFCRSRQNIARIWNPLVPLSRNSKVCRPCFQLVASMILSNHVKQYLPAAILDRPICCYGHECGKKHDAQHDKKYQHWFHPNTKQDDDDDTNDDQ